jgi:hypothetical protein
MVYADVSYFLFILRIPSERIGKSRIFSAVFECYAFCTQWILTEFETGVGQLLQSYRNTEYFATVLPLLAYPQIHV